MKRPHAVSVEIVFRVIYCHTAAAVKTRSVIFLFLTAHHNNRYDGAKILQRKTLRILMIKKEAQRVPGLETRVRADDFRANVTDNRARSELMLQKPRKD